MLVILHKKKSPVSRTQQGRQRETRVNTPVPHFLPNSGGMFACLRVEWQSSMPRLTSTPERRNENINLSKYFNLLECGSNPQPQFLQSHYVPLRHDCINIDFTNCNNK